MNKETFYLLLLGSVVTLFACNNQPKGQANNVLNDTDKDFLLKAKEANLAEISEGKLAQEKGGPLASYFGGLMVQEHTVALESIDSLAQALGQTLPNEISAKHQQGQIELSAKAGEEFDKAYFEAQITEHREVVSLFRKEKMSGSHEDVKGYAERFFPHIKMHLDVADSLQNEMGSAHRDSSQSML